MGAGLGAGGGLPNGLTLGLGQGGKRGETHDTRNSRESRVLKGIAQRWSFIEPEFMQIEAVKQIKAEPVEKGRSLRPFLHKKEFKPLFPSLSPSGYGAGNLPG